MRGNLQPRVWTVRTYDRLAKYYDFLMRVLFPIGEKGRERIAERLSAGSMLDVACGTGTLLKIAHEKGLKCFGLDISPGMLNQAAAKTPGAAFNRASFYEMPYPDGHFDYVVATNALSSDSIDAKRVLSEMIRVCKGGGGVFIAEWPIAARETLLENLIVKLASLNDDSPKDYLLIFREMGYNPDVEILNQRYSVFEIKKH